jgi:hypothetical protein
MATELLHRWCGDYTHLVTPSIVAGAISIGNTSRVNGQLPGE